MNLFFLTLSKFPYPFDPNNTEFRFFLDFKKLFFSDWFTFFKSIYIVHKWNFMLYYITIPLRSTWVECLLAQYGVQACIFIPLRTSYVVIHPTSHWHLKRKQQLFSHYFSFLLNCYFHPFQTEIIYCCQTY